LWGCLRAANDQIRRSEPLRAPDGPSVVRRENAVQGMASASQAHNQRLTLPRSHDQGAARDPGPERPLRATVHGDLQAPARRLRATSKPCRRGRAAIPYAPTARPRPQAPRPVRPATPTRSSHRPDASRRAVQQGRWRDSQSGASPSTSILRRCPRRLRDRRHRCSLERPARPARWSNSRRMRG
jgi:hypothetical protein